MLTFMLISSLLNSFPVVSSLTCNTPYDCNATTYYDMNEVSVVANGYTSAAGKGSITETGGGIQCRGAYSCQNTQSITAPISGTYFGGTGSGASISLCDNGGRWSSCYGSNSCIHSTIRAGDIHCYGDQSCAFSTMHDNKLQSTIDGFGAYSLKNAVIESASSSSFVTINFYGYHSGFGTSITCQPYHTCTINCYGNSCDYLQTPQCLGDNGTNCIINYQNTPPQAEIYPTVLLYDSSSITASNDANCNQPTSLSYDIYQQLPTNLTVDANIISSICCRASESCRGIGKIEYNGTVICSGYESCMQTNITIANSGDLFCEGVRSCGSILNIIHSPNSRNIYCLGTYSCQSATIIADGNIYCSGYRGCSETRIKSSGNGNNLNIYFLGHGSMTRTQIHCMRNDICRIMIGSNLDLGGIINPIICDGECIVDCPSTYNNCPDIITRNPTIDPTMNPSYPTFQPSSTTYNPTFIPTLVPTYLPTISPTSPPIITTNINIVQSTATSTILQNQSKASTTKQYFIAFMVIVIIVF